MGQIVNSPSPNCGPRKGEITAPDIVVLHYTAMQSATEAIERLSDPDIEVSAHYVIARDGVITQLVDEADRAWHAGAGRWAGSDDINSRSIGIELDNDGASPFSAPLMDALEELLGDILKRWQIAPCDVIGHSDLAPLRKIDPGPRFDWRRLALQELSIWPEPSQPASLDLETALTKVGYDVGEFGLPACLNAFRLRFRPAAQGAADATDLALASDLATRFGIDRAHPLA